MSSLRCTYTKMTDITGWSDAMGPLSAINCYHVVGDCLWLCIRLWRWSVVLGASRSSLQAFQTLHTHTSQCSYKGPEWWRAVTSSHVASESTLPWAVRKRAQRIVPWINTGEKCQENQFCSKLNNWMLTVSWTEQWGQDWHTGGLWWACVFQVEVSTTDKIWHLRRGGLTDYSPFIGKLQPLTLSRSYSKKHKCTQSICSPGPSKSGWFR